jgi:hypothetical protein
MLGHGVDGIAAHVRDDDAALLAGGDVEGVVTGRRNADHLELGQSLDRVAPNRNLIADRDVGVLEPFDHLVGPGTVVFDPFVRKRRFRERDRRADRGTVEENDTCHDKLQTARDRKAG